MNQLKKNPDQAINTADSIDCRKPPENKKGGKKELENLKKEVEKQFGNKPAVHKAVSWILKKGQKIKMPINFHSWESDPIAAEKDLAVICQNNPDFKKFYEQYATVSGVVIDKKKQRQFILVLADYATAAQNMRAKTEQKLAEHGNSVRGLKENLGAVSDNIGKKVKKMWENKEFVPLIAIGLASFFFFKKFLKPTAQLAGDIISPSGKGKIFGLGMGLLGTGIGAKLLYDFFKPKEAAASAKKAPSSTSAAEMLKEINTQDGAIGFLGLCRLPVSETLKKHTEAGSSMQIDPRFLSSYIPNNAALKKLGLTRKDVTKMINQISPNTIYYFIDATIKKAGELPEYKKAKKEHGWTVKEYLQETYGNSTMDFGELSVIVLREYKGVMAIGSPKSDEDKFREFAAEASSQTSENIAKFIASFFNLTLRGVVQIPVMTAGKTMKKIVWNPDKNGAEYDGKKYGTIEGAISAAKADLDKSPAAEVDQIDLLGS